MVIPPLPSDPVPGVPDHGLAVYADPPEVLDEGGERGEPIAGTRVERTTYVAEAAGTYRLDPIELAWWDVGAERMRTTALPALEVRVEPNPDLVAEIPLPPEETAGEAAEAGPGARVSVVELLRRWGVPLAAVAVALTLLSRWSSPRSLPIPVRRARASPSTPIRRRSRTLEESAESPSPAGASSARPTSPRSRAPTA
jgi:hypothetical protein